MARSSSPCSSWLGAAAATALSCAGEGRAMAGKENPTEWSQLDVQQVKSVSLIAGGEKMSTPGGAMPTP